MHEALVSERGEPAGTSAAVEGPTVTAPQDPAVSVVPDDAGDVLLSAARTAIAHALAATIFDYWTTSHTATPPAWAL